MTPRKSLAEAAREYLRLLESAEEGREEELYEKLSKVQSRVKPLKLELPPLRMQLPQARLRWVEELDEDFVENWGFSSSIFVWEHEGPVTVKVDGSHIELETKIGEVFLSPDAEGLALLLSLKKQGYDIPSEVYEKVARRYKEVAKLASILGLSAGVEEPETPRAMDEVEDMIVKLEEASRLTKQGESLMERLVDVLDRRELPHAAIEYIREEFGREPESTICKPPGALVHTLFDDEWDDDAVHVSIEAYDSPYADNEFCVTVEGGRREKRFCDTVRAFLIAAACFPDRFRRLEKKVEELDGLSKRLAKLAFMVKLLS